MDSSTFPFAAHRLCDLFGTLPRATASSIRNFPSSLRSQKLESCLCRD